MTANQRRAARSGFTLTELLVAVPLLVLVFWIVGNIFVTTQDTISLGMAHSKVTASAEAAVQRMARDLAGLRPDGRLVLMAWRTESSGSQARGLGRELSDPRFQFGGAFGQLRFIAMGSWQSLDVPDRSAGTGNFVRSNLAIVDYRPAYRSTLYWDSQALMRSVTLFCYNVQGPNSFTDGLELYQNTGFVRYNDLRAFPPQTVTVAGTPVVQQRTDLMREMFNANLYRELGGNTSFRAVPAPYPYNATVAEAAGPNLAIAQQDFVRNLLLIRCGLPYNFIRAPQTTPLNAPANSFSPSSVTSTTYGPQYPQGVLDPDPSPARDPGASAVFQWWGVDFPGDVPRWRPSMFEIPTSSSVQTGGSSYGSTAGCPTGGYYWRKFMVLRDGDANDQSEYGSEPAGVPSTSGRILATNAAPLNNQARAVPWPDAIRINLMVFDKAGRFRNGALFQSVVDIPTTR